MLLAILKSIFKLKDVIGGHFVEFGKLDEQVDG